MREFHHVGFPTDIQRPNETYLEGGKVFITDVAESPNSIEWLRFEDDSPMPDALKNGAHVAFKVDDIDAELAGQTILIEPFEPMEGVKVAFIMDGEAPIELMQVSE